MVVTVGAAATAPLWREIDVRFIRIHFAFAAGSAPCALPFACVRRPMPNRKPAVLGHAAAVCSIASSIVDKTQLHGISRQVSSCFTGFPGVKCRPAVRPTKLWAPCFSKLCFLPLIRNSLCLPCIYSLCILFFAAAFAVKDTCQPLSSPATIWTSCCLLLWFLSELTSCRWNNYITEALSSHATAMYCH